MLGTSQHIFLLIILQTDNQFLIWENVTKKREAFNHQILRGAKWCPASNPNPERAWDRGRTFEIDQLRLHFTFSPTTLKNEHTLGYRHRHRISENTNIDLLYLFIAGHSVHCSHFQISQFDNLASCQRLNSTHCTHCSQVVLKCSILVIMNSSMLKTILRCKAEWNIHAWACSCSHLLIVLSSQPGLRYILQVSAEKYFYIFQIYSLFNHR